MTPALMLLVWSLFSQGYPSSDVQVTAQRERPVNPRIDRWTSVAFGPAALGELSSAFVVERTSAGLTALTPGTVVGAQLHLPDGAQIRRIDVQICGGGPGEVRVELMAAGPAVEERTRLAGFEFSKAESGCAEKKYVLGRSAVVSNLSYVYSILVELPVTNLPTSLSHVRIWHSPTGRRRPLTQK